MLGNRTRQPLLPLLLLLFPLCPLGGCASEDATRTQSRDTGHPVLLLAADNESTEAWETTLRIRFGGCDLLPLDRWREASSPPARSLFVLTQGALASGDSTVVEQLRPLLQQGALVLLDRPMDHWERAAGLRTLGRTPLPPRWTEPSWSVWRAGDRASGTGSAPRSGNVEATADSALEYLVQRPNARGVRNVGTPLHLPTVWWRPEGGGGWIGLGLPLGEMVEVLRADEGLSENDRERWSAEVTDLVLDPDIFPRPLPRVWPQPTPGNPDAGTPAERNAAAQAIHWTCSALEDGVFRIQVDGGSPDDRPELAVPISWRGQVLADWDADWEGARSRKLLDAQREWRLLRAPKGQGVLTLRYRQRQGNSGWR